jgi:hypothetical protein
MIRWVRWLSWSALLLAAAACIVAALHGWALSIVSSAAIAAMVGAGVVSVWSFGRQRREARMPDPRPRGTLCEVSLQLGLHLLPPDARDRYKEEWDAERAVLDSRWARLKFTTSLLLVAIPRLAWTLRLSARRREPR